MKKRTLEDFGIQIKKKRQTLPKMIINQDECSVIYIKHFLTRDEEENLMNEMENIEFRQEIIDVYNMNIIAPRKTFSYGDTGLSYQYAGKYEIPNEWPSSTSNNIINDIRKKVHQKSLEFCDVMKDPFNFVLINRYKDGNDYIGFHSDNEKDIVPRSCIASLFIGAERNFTFINVKSNETHSLKLESGSLLLMMGRTQEIYKHGLPKSKNLTEKRYNLTFRHLINKK